MSKIDVIRAWKDEEYRATLTPEQLAALPDNPAGMVELSDADLHDAAGGTLTLPICPSLMYCPSLYTFCPSNITICPEILNAV